MKITHHITKIQSCANALANVVPEMFGSHECTWAKCQHGTTKFLSTEKCVQLYVVMNKLYFVTAAQPTPAWPCILRACVLSLRVLCWVESGKVLTNWEHMASIPSYLSPCSNATVGALLFSSLHFLLYCAFTACSTY